MAQSRLVIVTGAAGFIGSNLVKTLNRRGNHNILLVDNLNHPAKERRLTELRYAGFADKNEFRSWIHADEMTPAHTVFHLGACSSTTETNEAYIMDNNFAYTQELCRWALSKRSRFIYASSAATYGGGEHGYEDSLASIDRLQPLNLYGLSKQRFDLWAREQGLFNRIVGLKFFNVYGPHEGHKGDMRSVVNKAHTQINETGRLKLFKSHRPDYKDGEQLRDFVHVRDAVAVMLHFHLQRTGGGLFNCGTGKARSWLDLANATFAAMGREPAIDFIPIPKNIREKYQYFTEATLGNLRAAGYEKRFTSLEAGVKDYVKWLNRKKCSLV